MNVNEEKTTQANPASGINGSGIFRWDDPQEINKKLSNLTGQPVWEVNDDYYENTILKYYDENVRNQGQFMKKRRITFRAEFSITLHLTNRSRLLFQRLRVHTSMTRTATSILISCRRAVLQSLEAITNRFGRPLPSCSIPAVLLPASCTKPSF